jgi:very-short-patch-repair endonuclease
VPSRPPRLHVLGPTTRSAVLAAGLGERALRHPGVRRLSRDTYLPRALADDGVSRVAAVLLTAPSDAVASHRTAAELWGLEIPFRSGDARVHVTVGTGSAVRGRADRCVHRTARVPEDLTETKGVPVTTPARTWRDLAGVLETPALLAVTDQLLRNHCTPDELAAALTRRPGGRGAKRARDVLPLGDRRAGSPMESVLRWLLHEAGLPAPVLQYRIVDAAGRSLAEVDMAWPEQRVVVEFDGDVHRERDVFVRDLRRQNRIVLTDWTVLRYTSADTWSRPDAVVAEIAAALGR